MATSTVTKRPAPAQSSIGLKIMMAVSGLWFVFYVLAHMYGNLKLFAGQAAFDEYAHHLRTMFMPILPFSGFLWLFRLSLIVAVIAHVYSAFTLWGRARQARSDRYAVKKAVAASVSSRWMRWGGVALLAFIIFHLLEFTIVKFNVNGGIGHDQLLVPAADGNGMMESPFRLAVAAFSVWWLVLIYLLALIALGLHLHHGVWSACQTLGFTNTAKSRALAKTAGLFIALVVAVGFALPPLAVLFGIVKI